MTVSPRGVNDKSGSNGKSAVSVRIVSETSVSVAETGAIFSATPAGYGQLVVKVHGDIDMRSAPILSDYVCSRVGADVHLVLDLSVVGFFGVAGLNVFTALDEAVQSAGSSWCLVEGHPVHRLLEAAAVVPTVKRFKSVDEGLAGRR